MQNQNPNEEITIEAELSVALEELAIYTLTKKGENKEKIVTVLDECPSRAEKTMKRIARENISVQKANVQLEKLEFDYMDLAKLWHGTAHFKAKLKGTEAELKKVAGKEDKIFLYDWKKHGKKEMLICFRICSEEQNINNLMRELTKCQNSLTLIPNPLPSPSFDNSAGT